MDDRLCSEAMLGRTKTTISCLQAAKREGRKFAVLTCYDFTTARLMVEAGVEVIAYRAQMGLQAIRLRDRIPVVCP